MDLMNKIGGRMRGSAYGRWAEARPAGPESSVGQSTGGGWTCAQRKQLQVWETGTLWISWRVPRWV